MKTRPLISVILPIYNPKEDWLDIAINSVLDQSYRNYEVILVNDGSEKELEEYLSPEMLNKDKVRAFSQENQGFTGATNTAMKKAEGKYIAPIGQDDIWKEKKLEKQIEKMDAEDKFCFTKAEMIDENGEIFSQSDYPDNFIDELVRRNFIRYESALIDRELLENRGYLNEMYDVCSDYDLWLSLVTEDNYTFIEECLVQKRGHSDAGSSNPKNFLNEERDVVKKYIDQFSEYSYDEIWAHHLREKGKMIHSHGDHKVAREKWKEAFHLDEDIRSLMLMSLSFSRLYNVVRKAKREIS